jgi:hypothetical protein
MLFRSLHFTSIHWKYLHEKPMHMDRYKRFWIGFGDIHDDVGFISGIAELPEAAGVIISGDITTNGSSADAKHVLNAVKAVNPNVYAQIGNMDSASIDEQLTAMGINIHGRTMDLGQGVCLLGVGCSSPTPFGTPSELPDHELGRLLTEAHTQANDCRHLIVVAHDPPKNTSLDELPGGKHVGSAAVRAFIDRVQPDVCLSGHIHEGVGMEKIGETTAVNPGMAARGGYALIGQSETGLTIELRGIDA